MKFGNEEKRETLDSIQEAEEGLTDDHLTRELSNVLDKYGLFGMSCVIVGEDDATGRTSAQVKIFARMSLPESLRKKHGDAAANGFLDLLEAAAGEDGNW